MSTGTITADDAHALRAMLRGGALSLLAHPARQVLRFIERTEDRVAPFAHLRLELQLVDEFKVAQHLDHPEEFGQARRVDASVDDAGVVPDPNNHHLPAELRLGFALNGGEYFLVVGERCYSLDDLRSHGVLSGCDAALLSYTAKYAHRACAELANRRRPGHRTLPLAH